MTSPRTVRSGPDISVVIPFLDEEGSIAELYQALTSVLARLGRSYELLFVDDGSRDGGPAIVEQLAEGDPRVGLVSLRRNFGKAAALDAGFKRARGSIVFTMDADLQDDPEEIPNFLARLDEGFDLVSGWKKKRRDPITKTFPSRIFNKTVSLVSGLKLNDFNCGFKAYRLEALQDLDLYGELHRYVPVLLFWRGYRVTQIPVHHHPRRMGASKYGIERMARGFFDLMTVLLITRYRARPLHLFGGVGVLFVVCGGSLLAYLTVLWFLGHPIGKRPVMFLGLLLLMVGVQLISTGLLGEMIGSAQAREGRHYVVAAERLPRTVNVEPIGGVPGDPVKDVSAVS